MLGIEDSHFIAQSMITLQGRTIHIRNICLLWLLKYMSQWYTLLHLRESEKYISLHIFPLGLLCFLQDSILATEFVYASYPTFSAKVTRAQLGSAEAISVVHIEVT